MKPKSASTDPIRPPLYTEQIVRESEDTQESSVQGELDEIDELRARVDELARQHAVKDTMDIPMIRNPNEPPKRKWINTSLHMPILNHGAHTAKLG